MTKTIYTLVDDIYEVIQSGGVSENAVDFFRESLSEGLFRGLGGSRKPYLRLSGVGKPCDREQYLNIRSGVPEKISGPQRMRFQYGHMLEAYLLSLAISAGHSVQGMQTKLSVAGVKGHRDCIIDGVLIDVKTASPYSFVKFKDGMLKEEDPFGYIQQLSAYLYASQDDPLLKEKRIAGFLTIEKVSGEVVLDLYDLSEELLQIEARVNSLKEMLKSDELPEIPTKLQPTPQSKTSKNLTLCKTCTYCSHKVSCYPDARVFRYANGDVFLTHVDKEPKVEEVTGEYYDR